MSCVPSPGSATVSSGGSAGTVVTVSGTKVAPGTYSLQVVARSDDGTITRSDTITVTVT